MTPDYFFSIVIPAYEVQGNGVQLLTELLISLNKQTFKNFEVVISDHSIDDEIENFIKDWVNNFKIIYHRNTEGRGNSSINMNNGIRLSNAKYIKIIHIDDKFSTDESLEIIYNNIQNSDVDIVWGAVGFNHFYKDENRIEGNVIPEITFNELIGESALNGCPSISFFKNNYNILFDENLIIINDFDLYFNLMKKFGNPLIIKDFLITVRIHSHQVTNLLTNYTDKEKNEINYFKTKIL